MSVLLYIFMFQGQQYKVLSTSPATAYESCYHYFKAQRHICVEEAQTILDSCVNPNEVKTITKGDVWN